ncbi:MAG TPA: hypothetical protein VF824_11570 [Thermoanaerobaculia bacterium]|jgi:hypothetical protein
MLRVALALLFTLSANAALVSGGESQVTAQRNDVAAFDQGEARLAAGGDAFLAVWPDHDLYGRGDVFAARIAADGSLLDRTPLRVAASDADEDAPAIAFDGSRYLVVWTEPGLIRGRYVAGDGAMSEAFTVTEARSLTTVVPQVAWNGRRFLVIWDDQFRIRGAFVGGPPLDLFSTDLTAGVYALGVANGSFVLATPHVDLDAPPQGAWYPADVGIATIDDEGRVGERIVIAPATTPVFDLQLSPSGFAAWSTDLRAGDVRAYDGTRVVTIAAGELRMYALDGDLVVYGDGNTTYAQRIGSSQATRVAAPATPQHASDAASNGARTLVIVRGEPRAGFEFGPAGGDLYVSDLDRYEPLAFSPRHQQSPDVALAGSTRLAAWSEYIGSERRLAVLAARVGIDREPIDLHASSYHPVAPRVASNGIEWLVVYVDNRTIYGVRVAHDGTPRDAQPFVIATDVFDSDIAVAWDGASYVVVYVNGLFTREGPFTTVYAQRVSTSGERGATIALSDVGHHEFPAIASGPDGALVVWGFGTLEGALLSRGDAVTPVSFGSTTAETVSVAFNAGRFLVATNTIEWFIVTAHGFVTTPPFARIPLAPRAPEWSGRRGLDVEPYGDGFLLYWSELGRFNETAVTDVFATALDRDGTIIDSPARVATTTAGFTNTFAASGPVLLTYRPIGAPTREVSRVFVQTVERVANGAKRRVVRR